MKGQSKRNVARGKTAAMSPAADRGMRTFAEEDLAVRFTDLFPGTFAEDVLGDPLDKHQARLLDATVARRNVMELTVRSYGGGAFSPKLADRIDRAVLTHARVVGNLGERVVTLPADMVAAFLKDIKEDSPKEAVELIDAMPRLVKPQKALKAGGKA